MDTYSKGKKEQEAIAFIGTTAGATLRFRGALIRHFVASGFLVYVFCSDYDQDTKKAVQDLGGIPCDSPLNRTGLNPFQDIIATWRVSRLLRKLSIQKVFCYTVKPVIFGVIASKLANIRHTVGMLEGLGVAFTRRPKGQEKKLKLKIILWVQVFLYFVSFLFLKRLIILNSDDSKDLEKYGLRARDIRVLGGIGVPSSFLKYYDLPQETVFLFVGRLLLDKGIREFIQASSLVKKHYPHVVFRICGDYDAQNPSCLSKEELDEALGEGSVEYVGACACVLERLVASSVLVLPSYREGFPRVVQESLAVGRPVIVTDVPGCRDAVVHGEDGFMVSPFSPNDLAEKMTYFIENPHKIKEMGEKGHQKAIQFFNEDRVAKKLASWICEAL